MRNALENLEYSEVPKAEVHCGDNVIWVKPEILCDCAAGEGCTSEKHRSAIAALRRAVQELSDSRLCGWEERWWRERVEACKRELLKPCE